MRTSRLTSRDWRAIVLAGTVFGVLFIAFGLHTVDAQAYKWIRGKGRWRSEEWIHGARAVEIGWAHVCMGAALFAPWLRRHRWAMAAWFAAFAAAALFLLV